RVARAVHLAHAALADRLLELERAQPHRLVAAGGEARRAHAGRGERRVAAGAPHDRSAAIRSATSASASAAPATVSVTSARTSSRKRTRVRCRNALNAVPLIFARAAAS